MVQRCLFFQIQISRKLLWRLFGSSECFELMVLKNTRSSTQGKFRMLSVCTRSCVFVEPLFGGHPAVNRSIISTFWSVLWGSITHNFCVCTRLYLNSIDISWFADQLEDDNKDVNEYARLFSIQVYKSQWILKNRNNKSKLILMSKS